MPSLDKNMTDREILREEISVKVRELEVLRRKLMIEDIKRRREMDAVKKESEEEGIPPASSINSKRRVASQQPVGLISNNDAPHRTRRPPSRTHHTPPAPRPNYKTWRGRIATSSSPDVAVTLSSKHTALNTQLSPPSKRQKTSSNTSKAPIRLSSPSLPAPPSPGNSSTTSSSTTSSSYSCSSSPLRAKSPSPPNETALFFSFEAGDGPQEPGPAYSGTQINKERNRLGTKGGKGKKRKIVMLGEDGRRKVVEG